MDDVGLKEIGSGQNSYVVFCDTPCMFKEMQLCINVCFHLTPKQPYYALSNLGVCAILELRRAILIMCSNLNPEIE